MLNHWLLRLTMTFTLVLSSSCNAIADPPTVTAKGVVAAGAEFQATDAASNGLTIRMDVDRVNEVPTIDFDEGFRVVLTNNSQQPLRIFNPETRSGFYELSFQFTHPGTGERLMVRKRQIEDSAMWESLAENIQPGREIFEIAPTESFAIDMSLSEYAGNERVWTGLPDPNSSTQYLVVAHFESTNAGRTDGQSAWIGKCKSDAIAVHFAAENMRTPIDYLRCGFPASAIRLMKDDAKLINGTDEYNFTPLHWAAEEGYIDVVKWLLDHGADLNVVSANGLTPLHAAARMYAESPVAIKKGKWKEIIDLYFSAGAEYDVMTAICCDDVDRLSVALRKSPKFADDFESQSPLRLAASLGCLKSCRYLTDNFRVDVDDFERGNGYPIIMTAVAFPEIVKLLIAHGADLETRITWRGGGTGIDVIGFDATILHYAADTGVPETITILIDSGVDLFATDRDSQTALEIAAVLGKSANAEAIIKHLKFIAAPLKIRQSLLDRCLLIGASSSWDAQDSQRLKLIQVLVEAGADPNVRKDGVTPMLTAASKIHPASWVENAEIKRIIAYLIERGATVDFFSAAAIGDLDRVRKMLETNPELSNTRRPDGYPVLHFAVGMDNREIVSALLKAGCDVNIRNKSDDTGSVDETALHTAAFFGRADIASLLIESGADVNALDEHHGTPLDEARRLKNKIVEDLLLKHGATAGTSAASRF